MGWLTFLSTAIPPIGGVIIADFLMNRKRYQNFATAQFKTVNWVSIIAVAVGVAAGKFIPGVVPLNAVLGGAMCYVPLTLLLSKKTLNARTT